MNPNKIATLSRHLRRSVVCRSTHSNSNKRFKKTQHLAVITGLTVFGVVIYGEITNYTYLNAAGRFLRSLTTASLIAKDYVLVLRKEQQDNYGELLKEIHLKSANRLLETCLLNGGLYIKVGQGVAAINHMLPEEYTETLSKLQDQCLPTDKADIQKVFKEEFGELPEERFLEFDYKPIAAASLAQVFKGKTKAGNEIAIKVQYSDLQSRFPSDLGTMIFLQNIVEFFFKDYNFGWILRDIQQNLYDEMDFTNEGENSEKCSQTLSKIKYVYVPKVYWKDTTKRILTMEFVDGIKITDMNEIKQNNLSIADIDTKLFKIFSDQIFRSGFVHADPHPGNLFVRKTKSNQAEIVILDHGLYECLSENIRRPLCEFWEATVLRDEAKMKNSANELNIAEYKNFAEVLFQVPYNLKTGEVKTKLSDEDIEYMKKVGKENFDMIMKTLKEMPRNMLFVIRNLNTIRAISREHGDPVDRPKIMARYAQKCLYADHNYFVGLFKWALKRVQFEYCLMKTSLKLKFITIYLDTLYFLGRSPVRSKEIFENNNRA